MNRNVPVDEGEPPEKAFLLDQLQDTGSNSKEKYVLAQC